MASARRPTTPACPPASARPRSSSSWPASWRRSPRPPHSAWASTRPTCARSCTGRSRPRPRSTTSRRAAPAVCTLLYTAADKGLIAYFIDRAKLTEAQLRSVHALLAANADPSGVFRVSESDVPADDPRVAVAVLERAGALELFPARGGAFSGRLAEPSLSRP